jgi:N-acetylglucosaminyl-diphospho-decaprenol L-rhamnosyltransferase
MRAEPKLSVIIVTSWNVRDLVLACLSALERATTDIPHETIVVDNASTDDTVAAVRAQYPDVRIIMNATNRGFSAANNQALAVARGQYVLFLNPDTEVGVDAIRACVSELDADASVGLTGCKLVLEDGRVQLECARRAYLLRHLLLEVFYLHMLLPRSRICGDQLMSWWDHEGVRDVEAISGAFMCARTAVARDVGGLPEDVFLYHEDLSFCLRVRRAGWRIRYRGDVSTLHRWRGSTRKHTQFFALLEGAYKQALIREAQGRVAGAVARVVFAVKCAVRVVIASCGAVLPIGRVRQRYPRVFDLRTHLLQVAWAVAPFSVAHLTTTVPAQPVVQDAAVRA